MINRPGSVITDVIPLMKQFSLRSLFALILVMALLTGGVMFSLRYRELTREVERLSQTDLQEDIDWLTRRANHLEEGASLLVFIANGEERDDQLLSDLNQFTPGTLSCAITEFDQYPNLRLFNFFENRLRDDGTIVSIEKTRSIQLLVQKDSRSIIDKMSHTGEVNESFPKQEIPTAIYYFPDGTKKSYQILESGFRFLPNQ